MSESSTGPEVSLVEACERWAPGRVITAFAEADGKPPMMAAWDEWAAGWGWAPWEEC